MERELSGERSLELGFQQSLTHLNWRLCDKPDRPWALLPFPPQSWFLQLPNLRIASFFFFFLQYLDNRLLSRPGSPLVGPQVALGLPLGFSGQLPTVWSAQPMPPTSPKVPAALQPGVPRDLLSVGQSSRNRAAVPAFYSFKVSFKISVIGDLSHSLRTTSLMVAMFLVLSGPCLLMTCICAALIVWSRLHATH